MSFKIYVSTQDVPTAQTYRQTVQNALFGINEFAVIPMSSADVLGGGRRIEQARAIISDCQLFMGVYGEDYGEVPPQQTTSYAEQDYHIAQEAHILCLIFMPESARHTQDERQQNFKELLEKNHVIHYFNTLQELHALVVLNVSKYRLLSRMGRLTPSSLRQDATRSTQTFRSAPPPAPAPPSAPTPSAIAPDREATSPAPPASARRRESLPQVTDEDIDALDLDFPMLELDYSLDDATITGEMPPPDTTSEPSEPPQEVMPDFEAQSFNGYPFEGLVSKALNIAEPDIEQIVRRALQTHEAQALLRRQSQDEAEARGWMQVNPIFGEPMRGTQFQADIFMIMPFREHFDSIYANLIVPTVVDLNLTIKRGDDFSSISGAIMREVWAAINACRLVIVETTEINANVYYELGIAHTLGKPAILLTQHRGTDDLPFDLRHLRFLRYEDSIQGGTDLKQRLKTQILQIINDLERDD